MNRRDVLSDCHPLVSAAFFALVLGFSMTQMHPVCLAASLAGAAGYTAALGGGRALRRAARYALPTGLLAAVLNPLLSHRGMTILLYLPSGNPLTLESIVYGAAAAGMLAAVLLWFGCCTAVMTADKLLWLFGRAAPALSLVLSMTLRWVPRFGAQLRAAAEARRGLGQRGGRITRRIRGGAAVLSIVVTWALENALDTADSMRSRGYGLPGRTAFSIYRLSCRDRGMLAWLGFCGLYLLAGCLAGGLDWRYYPTLRGGAVTPLGVSFFLVDLALCLTPVFLNRQEARAWRRMKSGT